MPASVNLSNSNQKSPAPKENLGGSARSQASSLKNIPGEMAGERIGQPQLEVRTLLGWKSPSRPFKKREKEFFKTLGAGLFLVSVVLLFFREWLLIAAIGSFYFITYAFGKIPPEEVEHKITTQGVTTSGRAYLWRELSDFWFTETHGQKILNVDILPTGRLRFSGRLFILLGEQPETKVKDALAKYLPYREIPDKHWMDSTADWLAKKIPLEKVD
ncbi:MAG: hypothetical protein Q8P89_01885 [bacterium]|nr:hypothetical protein [bacterium]